MEEHGRDSECDDKRQPHPFGAESDGEGEVCSQRPGAGTIGEEGDTHRSAYILYATQHSGTDALQSVRILEKSSDEQ